MKKFIKWIKREIVWFCSPKVLNAIDNGATYEEVKAIVEKEANKKWMKRT